MPTNAVAESCRTYTCNEQSVIMSDLSADPYMQQGVVERAGDPMSEG